MNYSLLKKFLFKLNPEVAHNFVLKTLALTARFGLLNVKIKPAPVTLFGLSFPNPVGLAAGFDKNGDCIDWFYLYRYR